MRSTMKDRSGFKFLNNLLGLWVLFFYLLSGNLAAYSEEDQTKKATTQQIGGLLFDVDEGVKVEQGPGGSVYVKSNREYMQEKFESIERKLSDFEERLQKLEGTAPEAGESTKPENQGRKVLVS
jgi:hypothetical protein